MPERPRASEVPAVSFGEALRTDPILSRRAAALYCKEIVGYLKEQGLAPTFAHLRLAYLLGPGDFARIMQTQGETRVASLLSREIITANPFMRDMSVSDLVAKSARDLARDANDFYQHQEKSFLIRTKDNVRRRDEISLGFATADTVRLHVAFALLHAAYAGFIAQGCQKP